MLNLSVIFLAVIFSASFVSAANLSLNFDAGNSGLTTFIKAAGDIPAVPAAAPIMEETAPMRKKAEPLSISCYSPHSMVLTGKLYDKKGDLVLTDPARSLGLNPLTALPDKFAFERRDRAHEIKYSRAKFSSDATAWENFGFLLPKKVLSGEETGEFQAYFTIYTDNGNTLVPSKAVKLNCSDVRVKLFTDCEFQTDCPANEGCNKSGTCEYNSFIPYGEGNKCFSARQCHKGNTCENGHCVGLW